MLLFLQNTTTADWVGPTVALSLVVIALAFGVIAAGAALATHRTVSELQRLSRSLDSLHEALAPALSAIRGASAQGERLATLVGDEVEAVVRSSRALRENLGRRLEDLEEVYTVLSDEVEETALDLAATLRTLRRGRGWYARILRLLGIRRHRR